MKFDPDKHHRRSIRLKDYDYTQSGAYFVTICTHQRQCLFGNIIGNDMQLNRLGECIQACWQKLPHQFLHLELDAFIIMPNHIHGILILNDRAAELVQIPQSHGTKPGSIAAIVQNFKSVSSRRVNRLRQCSDSSVWQRNYYEHIIRDDNSLNAIRRYIHHNPQQWAEDAENPDVKRDGEGNAPSIVL